MVQRATQKAKAKAANKKVAKTGSTQPIKPPTVNGHGEEHKPEAGPSNKIDIPQSKMQVQIAEPDSTKQTLVTESHEISSQEQPNTASQTTDQAVEEVAINEAESTTKADAEQPIPAGNEDNATKSVKRKIAKAETRAKKKQPKVAENIESENEQGEPKNEEILDRKPVKLRGKRPAEHLKIDTQVPSTSGRSKKAIASKKTKAKRQKLALEIPPLKSVHEGKVFVIGENDVGQLGFGEEVEVKRRPVMLELPFSIADVVAGGMHSVCLTGSGEVITFGCNDEGALGRVTSEEGSECIPRKVDIPERIVQVSAGDSHTAALAESGQVYLWGNFRSGDGHMGLTSDGAKQMKPIKILKDIIVVKIASGSDHLVCLSKEGLIYTCGCGEAGQLGRIAERFCRDGGRKGKAVLLEPAIIPLTKSHINADNVWTGAYSTFFKAQESTSVYAFGLNNYNHLGFENENTSFFPKQVASFNERSWNQINGGQHHTLALDNEGKVHSLGRGDYGRLGLGENCGEKSKPTLIPTLENEKCLEISCGNCVSFALSNEGSVFSWGFGTNHQLGHGNDEDCHVPCKIEGNFMNSWKAHKVSGGGQHTLILASPKETLAKKNKK